MLSYLSRRLEASLGTQALGLQLPFWPGTIGVFNYLPCAHF